MFPCWASNPNHSPCGQSLYYWKSYPGSLNKIYYWWNVEFCHFLITFTFKTVLKGERPHLLWFKGLIANVKCLYCDSMLQEIENRNINYFRNDRDFSENPSMRRCYIKDYNKTGNVFSLLEYTHGLCKFWILNERLCQLYCIDNFSFNLYKWHDLKVCFK
jgi:hypothetical protein